METVNYNNKRIAKASILLALGLLSLISLFVLNKVYKTGSIEISFFHIGILEGFMWCFFNIIGLLVTWASISMIEYDLKDERIPLYYGFILGLIISLCGIVASENLLISYIFIEISTFLSVAIVMIKDEEKNRKAGIKYLTLSILASSIILMGLVILYNISSSIIIGEIGMAMGEILPLKKDMVFYSFIFLSIGIGLKSALFPFHIWLPDAHGSAPAPSSALLSGLVLKSYIIFFIKLIYKSYGIGILKDLNILPTILILGSMAMIYGSLQAIREKDLKRMIAYSSVAQIGYIFMGIGLGNKLGLEAALFHILAHGIVKTCLFLNAGSIIMATDNKEISKMKGIGIKLPITMTLFTICSLSMIGIPLFIGFNSKWNFGQAIMDTSHIWILIILSLSSLLNGLYYLPIVINGFFSLEKNHNRVKERTIRELMPIIILGILVIFLGLFSNPIMELIQSGISSIYYFN